MKRSRWPLMLRPSSTSPTWNWKRQRNSNDSNRTFRNSDEEEEMSGLVNGKASEMDTAALELVRVMNGASAFIVDGLGDVRETVRAVAAGCRLSPMMRARLKHAHSGGIAGEEMIRAANGEPIR
jgi:hypothetical protein